jgi:hypothetical protein
MCTSNARKQTNRVPIDVMRNTIPRQIITWDDKTTTKLANAIEVYGTENWPLGKLKFRLFCRLLNGVLVARYVSEDATPASCQEHWLRTLNPALKAGRWSAEEDQKLTRAVKVYGNSWVEIAVIMDGRTAEQCRDRYSEHLTPNITKGRFTSAEDRKLRAAVEMMGMGRWMDVSKYVGGGRTDSQVRTTLLLRLVSV